MMVERLRWLLSFWEGNFLRAVLNFRWVWTKPHTRQTPSFTHGNMTRTSRTIRVSYEYSPPLVCITKKTGFETNKNICSKILPGADLQPPLPLTHRLGVSTIWATKKARPCFLLNSGWLIRRYPPGNQHITPGEMENHLQKCLFYKVCGGYPYFMVYEIITT